jgi:hypothetical protein
VGDLFTGKQPEEMMIHRERIAGLPSGYGARISHKRLGEDEYDGSQTRRGIDTMNSRKAVK